MKLCGFAVNVTTKLKVIPINNVNIKNMLLLESIDLKPQTRKLLQICKVTLLTCFIVQKWHTLMVSRFVQMKWRISDTHHNFYKVIDFISYLKYVQFKPKMLIDQCLLLGTILHCQV